MIYKQSTINMIVNYDYLKFTNIVLNKGLSNIKKESDIYRTEYFQDINASKRLF